MKRHTLIATFLCFAIVALAQESKLSNYTRLFLDANKAATTSEQRATLRKNFALKTTEDQQEYVSAYVHFYDSDADKAAIEEYGALIDNDFGDFVTARIPVANIEKLSADEAVRLVELGTPVRIKMDQARTAAKVDKVQAGSELSQPFLGTGVIVGVCDYGFQYNHITFYDANNSSELRVKRVYDIYHNNKKYTTQSAIENAGYDNTTDKVGHATHVTGIAAGSYSGNNYYGIAKDADIVMVQAGETNTDLVNGIKYIFDYAAEVGKPAVINLSLGSHMGPHDGTSTFDRAIDALLGEGRIICGAAGNEGNYPIYSEATLAAGESHTFILDDSDKYFDGSNTYADFWGDEGQKYTVQVVYLDASGKELATGTETATATSSSTTTTWRNTTYASGTLTAYTQLSADASNNKGNVSVAFKSFSPKSSYKIGFKVTAKTAGTVRVWGDDYSAIYWEDGQTTHTVGEIGGTANNIISVGAWTTKTNTYSSGKIAGKIAGFSSKGPTADNRLKPEITAPGDVIMSSIPDLSSIKADGKTSKKVGNTTYCWAYMSGTSMATPFVTGVVATWLQANPKLTPAAIKNVFAQTAATDSYTGTCPNNTWGYGKIDAHAGLLKVISTTGIENLESMPDAIMLYPNPNDGAFQLLFTQNDNNVDVRVYAANGQQVYMRHIGNVDMQQTLDINLGGMQSGAYIVKIAGNDINQTCRLLVR